MFNIKNTQDQLPQRIYEIHFGRKLGSSFPFQCLRLAGISHEKFKGPIFLQSWVWSDWILFNASRKYQNSQQ